MTLNRIGAKKKTWSFWHTTTAEGAERNICFSLKLPEKLANSSPVCDEKSTYSVWAQHAHAVNMLQRELWIYPNLRFRNIAVTIFFFLSAPSSKSNTDWKQSRGFQRCCWIKPQQTWRENRWLPNQKTTCTRFPFDALTMGGSGHSLDCRIEDHRKRPLRKPATHPFNKY